MTRKNLAIVVTIFGMIICAIALGINGYVVVQRSAAAPTSAPESPTPPAPTVTFTLAPGHAPVAAVEPLSTDSILACDRRSVLYDESKHAPKPEPVHQRVVSMKPGDTAYILSLISDGGKVFVNPYAEVMSAPDKEHTVMIRRAETGFLVDCDSPELWVWLNEGAKYKVNRSDLIPVIGHIDVKPKPKQASAPGIVFRDTPNTITVDIDSVNKRDGATK